MRRIKKRRRGRKTYPTTFDGLPRVAILENGRAVYSCDMAVFVEPTGVRFLSGSTVGLLQAQVPKGAKDNVIILPRRGEPIVLRPGEGYNLAPIMTRKKA